MIKILVMGTLVLGTMVLLSNMVPAKRLSSRTRKNSGTLTRMTGQEAGAGKGGDSPGKIRKTEEQWKAELTEEQYSVTRCGSTERPYTGKFWNHHEEGTYLCVCCGHELFTSDTKFESGSGWPSYFRPVSDGAVDEIKDISYGMVRTEVVCRRCEAHLGHVFSDGPRPTGLRYCINSAALDFTSGEQTGTTRKASGE